MNAAIALPVLSDGDAIGADVLGMAKTLRTAGHQVTLYAEKSLVAEEVLPLESLMNVKASADDLLIYHHSQGCEPAVRAVRSWPGRAAVKYHNVTPAKYFLGECRRERAAVAEGLAQAEELAKVVPFWVDSAFNGRGLPCEAAVLPPFMPTEELRALDPDPGFAEPLDSWATTLLCVGRVAPNKNLLLAIDTLAEYRRRFDPAGRLVIAGGHVYPEYSEAVRERVREHDLADHVAITGRVSPAQLKALYLAADALLVTSDHEGFCVPLVEAMALGTPVVAVPHAAIPETAGPFAIYGDATPIALAEKINLIVADSGTRETKTSLGFSRYQEQFTFESIGKRFLELANRVAA